MMVADADSFFGLDGWLDDLSHDTMAGFSAELLEIRRFLDPRDRLEDVQFNSARKIKPYLSDILRALSQFVNCGKEEGKRKRVFLAGAVADDNGAYVMIAPALLAANLGGSTSLWKQVTREYKAVLPGEDVESD
jgi:hypothetical protein